MNKIFKVVWSASKQCYVVASELATNTSGKKKIMVAIVLAALAMGGSLQAGAETVVTADQVNAMHIKADTIKVENRGILTEIQGDVMNISTGHDLDSWVTQLQPGLLAVKNGDAQFMVGEGSAEITDLEHKNGAGMMPKGFGIFGENNKEMQFTLDKVDVGSNKIENVAEGTEDTDAVNLKQLKSYVNATDKDTHSTVTAGENIEVNTSTNSDNTTNYEVKLKKDLTGVNSISLEGGVNHETIKLNGNDGSIKAGNLDVNNIAARSITFEGEDIVTKIDRNELSMIGNDISGIPWKTILNPGLIAVETSEINTYISRHGFHMSDVDETSETYIEPKGITLGAKDGKILEFNLDKVSVGGNKIENVAEGTADTDAVNVKQLKSYVDSKSNSTPVRIPTISQNGVNTNVLIGANPDGSTNYTVSVNPDLLNMNSAEFGLDTEDKRAIVNKEKAQFFDGDVNTAITANGTKLENTNNLDTAEYTMDGMQANSNGKLVRFGTLGINAGDQVIAGVKAGVADTDVVNVKQLKDSITQASDAAVAKSAWNLSANGGATETISGGDTVNFVSGNNVEVTRTGKDITVGTKDNVTFTKATVGNVVVDGTANTVTGLANTTWDANNVTANRAATEGQLKEAISNISNLAVDAAGVKLGYKADGANAQTTSLKDGLNFKSGELTTATVGENGEVTYNVKTSTLTIDGKGTVKGGAGVATSDNVAKVINQVVQQNSSDTKELKQAISNVSTESQRVGAHAAAMAALKPIQYDPMEPTQVMAGIGNYRGETAAALGLAHYTNENTMLNVGVSLGGTHNMVNAGVTHKFGSSPEKKNIPDRYKGGPISSIYVMQDELTQMQAKNEAQQAKIDAQQAQLEQQQSEIDSLKAVVNQLLAKA
jgi:yadA domain protein